MLNFCDFIQVYVFTTNHHLKTRSKNSTDDTLFLLLSSEENTGWFVGCFGFNGPLRQY